MHGLIKCLTFVTGLCFCTSVAAEPCIELIRHAMYDEVAGSSEASSYNEARTKFCKSTFENKDNKERADTGASYMEIFKGKGDFSAEQRSESREAMCDEKYSLDTFNSKRQLFTRTLNAKALSVVDSCIRATSQGLRFTVEYPDEDKLVASVVYLTPGAPRSEHREVNSRVYVEKGIKCTGALADAKKGTQIASNSMDMVCERLPSAAPVKIGDQQFIHLGGLVIISTTVGPLTALMPKKPDPNYKPQAPQLPVEMSGKWMYRGLPSPNYAMVASVAGTKNLTFTNERGMVSQGWRANDLTVEAFDWSHITAEIRDGGQLLIWSNGTWWSRNDFDKLGSRSDRPITGVEWRYTGRPCIVTGTDQNLTFINEKGQGSAGKLIDPTTVEAWGLKGKLVEDRSAILWSNGTVWLR